MVWRLPHWYFLPETTVFEICGWDCQTLFLVSADLSPIIHPPGTAPTSEPAIETTSLHQPTPPHTGLSLVASSH